MISVMLIILILPPIMSIEEQTIGVMVAIDREFGPFEESWNLEGPIEIGTFEFYETIIDDKRVVFCKSGYGKVNSATATALLIEHFDADEIILRAPLGL